MNEMNSKRLPNYNPEEHTPKLADAFMTRRQMLTRTGMGMGAATLGMMLGEQFYSNSAQAIELGAAAGNPLAAKAAHFAAKAKHVIHIFAAGGPSHVDTWDHKPALEKYVDQVLPGTNGLSYPTAFKFSKRGKSGMEVSEVFPRLGNHVDDICLIKSMWTDVPAHEPASKMMHTGSFQLPKPCAGAWTLYGLGFENQNMPGFISLGGKAEYRQSGFLPSMYQGVNVNYNQNMSLNQILLNIRNQFTSSDQQTRQLELAKQLNDIHSENLHKEEQLESRIQSFEMAFKMQTEATDAFDINKESAETKSMYGVGTSDLAAKLLVARRLVERGVRFVQVFDGGWDMHGNLEASMRRKAANLDQPAAALIADLKRRGLLDSTLIIWGGEFGRTVTRDKGGNANPGRDHNGRAFCTWMAGGGVKGGTSYGETDEFGARAEVNRVHIHDLHATWMALLGFDHKKLTYRYNGRDFRFTDNFGNVVKEVIA